MSGAPAKMTGRRPPGKCQWCGTDPVSNAWFRKWCRYECAKLAMAAQP